MGKLNTFVHAVERDDRGDVTNSGTFGPDDDLSKPENSWVPGAITNPDVWEGSGQDAKTVSSDADQSARPVRSAPNGKAGGK